MQCKWGTVVTVASTFVMLAILGLFYGTEHKPLALRLIRTVDPLSLVLPWLTQGMRLNLLNVRLHDLLVLMTMAIQGFAIGSVVDLILWLRRRKRNL